MGLRLKNTYTRQVETFVPRDPTGPVTLYTCGPTVYSHNQIGNFRSFLMADVLRRVLELRGHGVRQVMNLTDVGHLTEDHLADASGEDKLAQVASQLGWDPYRVAACFEQSFVEDAQALGLRNYSGAEAHAHALHPRATQYVPEMLAMIQVLIERGHAYVDADGQVYFSVASFPEYGRLSGKVLAELNAGVRVAVRSEKRDPRDFALWKVDPKHLMQWDPHGARGWADGEHTRLQALVPHGIDRRLRPGFPGWHIECSAMARAQLGPEIDLHTGGEDNIFPHHECEIAQSYGARRDAAADKSFARYWLHARFLLVNGQKMSKRDGSQLTVKSLLDPARWGANRLYTALCQAGFAGGRVPAAVLRLALIGTPFSQPMSFGVDVLVQARAGVERLQSLWSRLQEASDGGAPSSELRSVVTLATRQLDAALDDQLNTSQALAATFGAVGAANQRRLSSGDARLLRGFLDRVDHVFGALTHDAQSGSLSHAELAQQVSQLAPLASPDPAAIGEWLVARFAARRAGDYARADAIRDALAARGFELEDTREGVRWRSR